MIKLQRCFSKTVFVRSVCPLLVKNCIIQGTQIPVKLATASCPLVWSFCCHGHTSRKLRRQVDKKFNHHQFRRRRHVSTCIHKQQPSLSSPLSLLLLYIGNTRGTNTNCLPSERERKNGPLVFLASSDFTPVSKLS